MELNANITEDLSAVAQWLATPIPTDDESLRLELDIADTYQRQYANSKTFPYWPQITARLATVKQALNIS
jgi:hypothetical protein